MFIDRSDLFRCLQSVIKIIPKNSSIPILSGVALKAKNNILTVRGSDMETGIEVQAACQGELETVLPGKLFFDVVSKLSGDTVEIGLKNEIAEIECGRSHYQIATMDIQNYPLFPEIQADPFVVPLADLNLAIKKSIFCASNDETRGALTGLCLDLKRKTLSATDGHRLSEIRNLQVSGEGQYVIPSKTAKELIKINGGNYHVKAGDGQIEFIVESPQYVKLFSRLIEGEFPSSEGVMPEDFDTIFFFNHENLIEVLNRINIIQPESVILNIKTKTISAESINGKAQEQVEFWFEKEGKLERFAFNPQFLIEPLGVMEGGQVIIKANSEIKPMVLEERGVDGWKYLFMPLNISEES